MSDPLWLKVVEPPRSTVPSPSRGSIGTSRGLPKSGAEVRRIVSRTQLSWDWDVKARGLAALLGCPDKNRHGAACLPSYLTELVNKEGRTKANFNVGARLASAGLGRPLSARSDHSLN